MEKHIAMGMSKQYNRIMKEEKYNPSEIEPKWQAIWEEKKLYRTPDKPKKKMFVLDMFPYPSGAGLHVGHIEGYTGTDILSRYLRMKGYDLLHPIGWDAFGLPAENYAIKNKIPPDKSTHDNIKTFKRQINRAGLSYDWEREIDSSSPEYYKWTQWLFILLYRNGLAYKKKAPANWCPKDETVLANEQVVNGKCERCGTEVVQKDLEQWFFKITDYADRLIEGLKKIDWPKSTLLQQENWIGRKEGINIFHKVKDLDLEFSTFSAYPAWIFADTFIVIAPNHPLVSQLVSGTQYEKPVEDFVKAYMRATHGKIKTKLDEKEGIFAGRVAIDPLSGAEMPIWLANFALLEFGTGIIRCSCHDPRDYGFAKKYNLPLKEVVTGGLEGKVSAHDNRGTLINSGPFTGRDVLEVIPDIVAWVEKKGYGERKVNYHLRDWLISRQRYWGPPIPMVFCEKCGWQPVRDMDLPVLLPTDVDFEPHGESPIASSKSFQQGVTCSRCGGPGRREVDTMDTFVDSAWYFLRFADPKNDQEFASKDKMALWEPVDVYVGGAEHTVLHLMYARFCYKFLYDLGMVPTDKIDEPFLKMRHQGTVLGPDSRKMSKRWGNVINPDDVIARYGADTLRIYEMFMGPFEAMKPWNDNSVAGVYRFLGRIRQLFFSTYQDQSPIDSLDIIRSLNKLQVKVENDITTFNFNTAVSAMMEFVNQMQKFIVPRSEVVEKKSLINDHELITMNSIWSKFLLVLAPFAPHLAEELWQKLQGFTLGTSSQFTGSKKTSTVNHEPSSTVNFVSIHQQPWPTLIEIAEQGEEIIQLPVQVNGKVRAVLSVKTSLIEKEAVALASQQEGVKKYLVDKTISKVVYVPNKILNLLLD